ncbi:MAG: aminotransferase class IV [Candidatus Omnitrophica bacterium]|nr:aminotransferase class IV [Candidatus Omnitrophota bacterium]MCM8802251.1 aminotransferase class IV [Candidatus Omnitrophota bacterium]
MKSEILLFNGKKVDEREINFSHLKRGFLYGDGIFETMISINKKIFRFDEHWNRMVYGARVCNLEVPDKKLIKKLIVDNLNKGVCYIRLNLWRKKPDKISPERQRETNFFIIIRYFKPYPEKFYKDGMVCGISEKIRKNSKSVISKIKSLNFLENVILKIEAEEESTDDMIVLDNYGYISEGSVSNIFFVKNNVIYTPSLECGCLEGITRKVVFEICEKENIKIKEGCFKIDFLNDCDEVFLTNTLMGIMPIREVKGYFKSKSFRVTQYLIKKYLKILEGLK